MQSYVFTHTQVGEEYSTKKYRPNRLFTVPNFARSTLGPGSLGPWSLTVACVQFAH